MKIALAQPNPTVGDLKGNALKIVNCIKKARKAGSDLVIFPELSLTGYPPGGLLVLSDFIADCQLALNQVLEHSYGIGVLLGTVIQDNNGKELYNSALLLKNKEIIGYVLKRKLNSCADFDEACYFESSYGGNCLEFNGEKLAICIGQDLWEEEDYGQPMAVINVSADSYRYGELGPRIQDMERVAKKYGVPLLYVNQVGGNDELSFAGASLVLDGQGKLIIKGKTFTEDMVFFDTHEHYSPLPGIEEDVSWVYNSLVLGMRDYFYKSGFKKTLLGLSGGIDAALVACIAADALGPENVLGVFMPSRYSSQHSSEDALALAENLGIGYRVISIEDTFKEYLKIFNGTPSPKGDLAEENIQARIRGNLLMFIANREGRLLVSTSNRSEAAVGYTTMYGDMCGGLSVIGDIPKTYVYKLCRYINRDREIIPQNILIKPPSAELRPDQKDEDTLPPYPVLDAILHMYLHENASVEGMVARGYERQTVCSILNMVHRMEYKRKQAPLTLKVFSPAVHGGRKNPIVQKYSWL